MSTADRITEAVRFYHSLLEGPLGPPSATAFFGALEAGRLRFGDRPICTSLRPHFVARPEAARLRDEARLVVSALRKLRTVPLQTLDPTGVLGHSPDEAAVMGIDMGFSPEDAIARIDAFHHPDGTIRFIEYNAESPGGIAFGETLARIYRSLPVFREFERRFPCRIEPVLPRTLDALAGAFRIARGQRGPAFPSIAIVDFRDAPTFREFEICRDHFIAEGHPAVVADPSELVFEGGVLRAGDFRIDIVYKRVLVGDLIARFGIHHPIFEAARQHAAVIVNGFQCHWLFNKGLFAFLSDGRADAALTPAERAAVARTIPWTRVVAGGRTTREGRTVDLVEEIRRDRTNLVLKPLSDYGGRGVILGWRAAGIDWDAAIATALREPHVVQERVALPHAPFPFLDDGGRIVIDERFCDIDPYVFAADTAGFGVRLSPSELLNVSAGGGSAVPAFEID